MIGNLVNCNARSEDFGLPVGGIEMKNAIGEEEYSKFKFEMAPIPDKYGFGLALKTSETPEKKLMEVKKGTTTLGFQFQGGVILAVDSRASMGQFNSSETVRKIIEIDDRMLGTMAGGAADCQFWEGYLGNFCRLYQLQNGERLSTAAASKVFANIMYRYRGKKLKFTERVMELTPFLFDLFGLILCRIWFECWMYDCRSR